MNQITIAILFWAGLLCGPVYAAEYHIHPGLKQIMAEGAARAIGTSHRGERWTLTCDDVRAIVERVGEAYAIAAAQAYGAGEAQITIARQCLTKKTKK